MSGFLLDTNQLSAAVRMSSPVRRQLVEAKKSGERVGTCIPALCELEAGIQQVSQPDLYRKSLARLLVQISIWPLDLETSRLYGELYVLLRRSGRVLSQVDIMLAALARRMNLTLVTSDRDFAAVPQLATVDWQVG